MQKLWDGGGRNIEGVICQLVMAQKVWGMAEGSRWGGGKETSASTFSCHPESIDDGIFEPSPAGSLPSAKEISYLV